ncbi:MAG: hypothetical protein KJO02_01310 [Erythrobacter sp.]|nr:hypothetical protein [Erythrobacter sp.]NNC52785.1 hypothetical protein [Erythrobacter sp.]RZV34020.1 MAG: hypothetical protein EX262_05500 [Sphingomonadaceae bacterium]
MIADTPESRELSPVDALEAALDWWREAGVEDDYRDEATSWLAEPEEEQAVASPKPRKLPEEPKQTPLERAFEGTAETAQIGGAPGAYPETLEKFREWWMTERSLSQAGVQNRPPPRGVAGAKLMVIIPEPTDGDTDELLSGAPARFLEAVTGSMGLQQHELYLASALPAPVSLPDWAAIARQGMTEVTRHHITLAAPHRVLVFGRALAPLFDIPPDMAREPAVVKAGENTLPLMLAPQLAELARSAPRRRNFWNRWLEWTA